MKNNQTYVFTDILKLFLIWRIALFFISYLFYLKFPNLPDTVYYHDLHPLLAYWLVFDSGWLINISHFGYWSVETTAFFPLWPTLIAIVSKMFFFIDHRIVGLLLSNIIALLNCWTLFLLVKRAHDQTIAYRSVKYLLFFPTSFFLGTAYSENLFLLTVLLSFYFLDKKDFFLSGISALFASLTKPFGVFLFLPLILKSKIQEGKVFINKSYWLLFSLLGLPLYMLLLKIFFGNYLIFLEAHKNPQWGTELGFKGFFKIVDDLRLIFSFKYLHPNYPDAVTSSGLFIFLLLFLLVNFKKINFAYFIYSLLILVTVLFTNSINSIGRYSLLLFPVFIILGLLGRKRFFHEFITIFFLVLLSFYTGYFLLGGWVG